MHGLKRVRSAEVVGRGHAFVQILRRGHDDLGFDTEPWPAALARAVVVAAAPTACASTPSGPAMPGWIADRAAPLVTADPAALLDDLEASRHAVGDAQVAGPGESVHGAAELVTLKHRALRMLVESMGFRTVAWEEDWTTGLLIDEYIRSDTGDRDVRLDRMRPQYRSGEVANVLTWLRDFNVGRSDPVRFVGVEYYFAGPEAYDAVAAYTCGRPHRTGSTS